jgi:hypothetical protein
MRNIPPGCIAYAHTTGIHEELIIRFEEFIVTNKADLILTIMGVIFAPDKV